MAPETPAEPPPATIDSDSVTAGPGDPGAGAGPGAEPGAGAANQAAVTDRQSPESTCPPRQSRSRLHSLPPCLSAAPDSATDSATKSTAATKAALRVALRARRRDLAARLGPAAAGAAMARVVLSHLPINASPPTPAQQVRALPALIPGLIVAGYWPMGAEIDPRPLMQALAARGCRLALPEVVGQAHPLRFRLWRSDADSLIPGPHGTHQPDPRAPVVQPDWILLPLLGFDGRGYRLGQGGGFYDRTLAALTTPAGATHPPCRLGLAFAGQRVAPLPVEPHDHPLPGIATERGLDLFDPDAIATPPPGR